MTHDNYDKYSYTARLFLYACLYACLYVFVIAYLRVFKCALEFRIWWILMYEMYKKIEWNLQQWHSYKYTHTHTHAFSHATTHTN